MRKYLKITSNVNSIELPCSSGNVFEIFLDSNKFLYFSKDVVTGEEYTIILIQDSVGGRTVTFDNSVTITATINSDPNATTILKVIANNGTLHTTNTGLSTNSTAEEIDAVVGAETVKLGDVIEDLVSPFIPIIPEISNNLLAEMQLLGSPVKAIPIGITNPGASSYALSDGTLHVVKVYIPEAMTITGVMFGGTVEGVYTADNFNGAALFSVEDGTLTRVALTANSGNLWKVNYWGGQIAFTAPYSAQPGLYAIAILYNSSEETTAQELTTGTPWTNNMALYAFDTDYSIAGTVADQSTIPASIEEADITPFSVRLLLMLY